MALNITYKKALATGGYQFAETAQTPRELLRRMGEASDNWTVTCRDESGETRTVSLDTYLCDNDIVIFSTNKAAG